MVTIKDIARESGSSVTTVSMVLSDGPSARRISDATKKRIWKTATKLGYRPNVFARSLRSNRSRSVGVIVFDITDPYCAQILRAVENHLQPSGYSSVLADLQNNRAHFQRCLDMLLERRVEGIIAIANWTHLESTLVPETKKRNLPAVIIGREIARENLSSVVVDNAAGTRQAIQHLYELGHSRFAFIKGPKSLIDSAQRWQGIEGFAQEVGIRIDPDLVVEIKGRNSTYAEGCQLVDALLARKRDFTALVAFDDLTACAAIRALTRAGRAVPQDCSVVGFDDIPYAEFYNPPLTTIQQQLEMQGTLGAQMIEELIAGVADKRAVAARRRRVTPRLIVRDSTSTARRS